MSTVHVVLIRYDYEGQSLVGVRESLDAAKRLAEQNARRTDPRALTWTEGTGLFDDQPMLTAEHSLTSVFEIIECSTEEA